MSRVSCPVCAVDCCRLEPGQTGRCKARKNEGGRSVSVSYGQLTSIALDPVEKKPLKRFCPGSKILSVGSFGCNLSCPFCQNHEISMRSWSGEETVYLSPEGLADKALALRGEGNIGVAFTYNEPLVGYEYVRDAAAKVRQRGLKNVVVTNGSVSEAVEEAVLPFIDAMNVDLKGFTPEYYRKLGGDLETVKSFILRALGRCHIEVTTLIVPGENDTAEEMEALSSWLAAADPEIPLHVSRFFPRWRMADREPTAVRSVYELAAAARRHLRYVYAGNC